MVTIIVGFVILISLYAFAYRTCCSKKEAYHDTPKEAAVHVAVTLFTYVLHLFDTLSDGFLFLHYINIGQVAKSGLIMMFIVAPNIYLAMILFGKQHSFFKCWKFARKSFSHQCLCIELGFLVVILFIPFGVFVPTFVYVFRCINRTLCILIKMCKNIFDNLMTNGLFLL